MVLHMLPMPLNGPLNGDITFKALVVGGVNPELPTKRRAGALTGLTSQMCGVGAGGEEDDDLVHLRSLLLLLLAYLSNRSQDVPRRMTTTTSTSDQPLYQDERTDGGLPCA